ncbi:hypothetical protein A2707_04020 [Candidatus Saccharibacteria bacterium RIFCSPHIGHO2_01_FULL_45_15]|nr:MAG: hypothetical protein A2707_04020 [Candidatus Saccharibacteria bacterium RIFCSPHIGHO2_01_FULL_45_15]OGL27112.1 MAG: hypothetical protein A3C39_00920 [Candidatus Saccharibacteria bacterium RIFCSPHIGHO2_02_FULL_46_12]OGL31560.1 MAG: hypothetical protein A3E76_02400 [Candidatus Saccharibacteria bacterium RIFCSPHIGHO2_12_FULL_44_22]
MMSNKIQLATLRQNFAQCVFTHQVQEAAANRNFKTSDKYSKINIGLVAGVLVMLVLQSVYQDAGWYTALGSGLAIGEILFLIVQQTFNVDQKAVLHKNAALQYMTLRDQYPSLISDVSSGLLAADEYKSRRDHLSTQYEVVSKLSPQTDYTDYLRAQKSLGLTGDDEQYTWSDTEINRFLPKELHSNK